MPAPVHPGIVVASRTRVKPAALNVVIRTRHAGGAGEKLAPRPEERLQEFFRLALGDAAIDFRRVVA